MTQAQYAWHKENDAICFSVTSNGRTGRQWLDYFQYRDFRVEPMYAGPAIFYPDFKPTMGVTTGVVVLRGDLFSDYSDRSSENICAEAKRRKLQFPNAEVACLIRDKFTDEDLKAMGLQWILVMHMHELLRDFRGDEYSWDCSVTPYRIKRIGDESRHLLRVGRDGKGRWIDACTSWSGYRWGHNGGFAFAVSSTSAEASADKQVSS